MIKRLACVAGVSAVAGVLQGCVSFTDTTSNRDPMAFSKGLEPSPNVWYEPVRVYYTVPTYYYVVP